MPTSTVFGPSRVEVILLVGQELSDLVIPPQAFVLDELDELNLDRNNLRALPGDLRRFGALRWLHVAGNQLCPTDQAVWWDGLAVDDPADWRLTQYCNTSAEYKSDSIAVRAILDSNQLYGKTVRQVTYIEDGRIRRISWTDPDELPTLLPSPGISLTVLPSEVGQLTALEGMDLRGNRLGSVPPTLGALSSLRYLNLQGGSGCRIGSLPPELGSLANLRWLGLLGCSLDSLPECMGAMANVETLSVAGNHLVGISESIVNLKKLSVLYLSHNPLGQFPPVLCQMNWLWWHKHIYHHRPGMRDVHASSAIGAHVTASSGPVRCSAFRPPSVGLLSFKALMFSHIPVGNGIFERARDHRGGSP